MTARTRAELAATPGVAQTRDDATRDFVFNHTMLRVKDAAASLDFYTRVLGFTLARKVDFDEAKFSLLFLVLVDDDAGIPDGDAERKQWLARQRGVLELTHNHGTEHQRLEALGVPFQKKLSDGSMKEIAFIKDPDGYWIELIQPMPLD